MATSAKKNFVYQALYELLVILTPLILSPYVSRVLGAENSGIYSLTHTYANYFVLFAALGIKNYGNREIAKKRDDPETLSQTFSSILFLHLIVSAIAVVGYYLFSFLTTTGNMRMYMYLMGVYVISALFDISWLFFGLEQFRITVIRNSVLKILSVVLTFCFVRSREDLWKYILIFAASQFLSQIYLWSYIKKYTHIRKVSGSEIVSHLPQMLLLFIPTVAISLYNYMDKIMVGIISSNTELGLYDNAEKIIFTASQVIGAVGTVMMPKMSNVVEKKDKSKVQEYIDVSMKTVMCMTFAMTGGIIAVAKTFSPVFWGEEFRGCAVLLAFLALALPFKGFANVLRTQFLIPNRRDTAYTISVCAGAVVNLIVNYLLISRIQALGAVVGTIIAEFTVCIIQIFFCTKELPIVKYLIQSLPYLIIGIIMCVPVYFMGVFIKEQILTLVIQITFGVFSYCTLCYIYFRVSNQQFFLKTIDSVLTKIPFLKKLMK